VAPSFRPARFLGVWLVIACFAWLAFSFTGLLSPQHESTAFKFTQPFAAAEVATMLWLAIIGTKGQRLAAAKPGEQQV